jgi:hypothetical protein
MTTQSSSVPIQGSLNSAAGTTAATTAASPARPPSWAWRRSGLLLSGAAQLITISALLGIDAPVLSWARLLLAIAPIPLAVAALLLPAPWRLAAIAAACVALVAGIAGGWLPTGFLFLPAVATMAVAGIKAQRER